MYVLQCSALRVPSCVLRSCPTRCRHGRHAQRENAVKAREAALKAELERKRKQKEAEFGGRKYVVK